MSTVNLAIGRALQPNTLAAAATTHSASIQVEQAKTYVNVLVNVTAVSGSGAQITLTPEWSIDGTTWAANDGGGEAFAAISAVGTTVKQLTPKGPFLRFKEVVAGTTPSITYSADLYLVIQD